MKKTFALAVVAVFAAFPAISHAQAWDVLRCQLNEGKTFADLEQVVAEFRLLMDKAQYEDFSLQIMRPLSGPRIVPGQFFWIGSAPTAERLGSAHDYWFSDASAARTKEKLDTVFLCDERWAMRTVFEH
jgi:hypothetical protein